MTTLTYTEKLYVQTCISCGVRFGIPDDLDAKLRENHRSFYCPNGHSQQYTGKTEAQKLREELEEEQRRVIRLTNARDQLIDERDHAEAKARGYKGALAQAKKRSAKGVCPAPGCKRSFVDVAKHVATKHPELVDPADGHTHGDDA